MQNFKFSNDLKEDGINVRRIKAIGEMWIGNISTCFGKVIGNICLPKFHQL